MTKQWFEYPTTCNATSKLKEFYEKRNKYETYVSPNGFTIECYGEETIIFRTTRGKHTKVIDDSLVRLFKTLKENKEPGLPLMNQLGTGYIENIIGTTRVAYMRDPKLFVFRDLSGELKTVHRTEGIALYRALTTRGKN